MEYISFVSNEGQRVILPLAAAKYCQLVLRLTCGVEALHQLPNGTAKLHRDVNKMRSIYNDWLLKHHRESDNWEEEEEEEEYEFEQECAIADHENNRCIQKSKADDESLLISKGDNNAVKRNLYSEEEEMDDDDGSVKDDNSTYSTESELEDEEERTYTCFVKPYLCNNSHSHSILEIPLHCIELDTLLRVCEYLVLRYQANIMSPGTYCELRDVFNDLDNCSAEDQKRALELLCAADLLNC